jgi:hypothetical protein
MDKNELAEFMLFSGDVYYRKQRREYRNRNNVSVNVYKAVYSCAYDKQ